MKRLSYLAPIAAMTAVVLMVVGWSSPYSPVVQPCRDIEEIWAIEDEREESDSPLFTVLYNHGQPLAYDREQNTFYCPIGLEHQEEWPQLKLTVSGEKGLSVCFVDDYSYDFCGDALRDGYAYQMIAYNGKQYSYAQIVFTGLPVVMIDAEQSLLPHEDVPVAFAMSVPEGGYLETTARAHERGDTSLRNTPKHGVKVEFTRKDNGRKKTQADMPILGRTDEFILLPGSMDKHLIRDYLSWELYNGVVDDDVPFGRRIVRYVELFVNESYRGVYLMMEPYDYAEEIAKTDVNAPARDSLYRSAGRSVSEFDKPLAQDHHGVYYENHYMPAGAEPFAALKAYFEIIAEQDDALFCEKAEKYLDLDSVIRYALLVQACGMTDNIRNNLYIWAHMTDHSVIYRFSPWDMDVAFGRDDEGNTEVWYPYELFDRLLELDCGDARSRASRIWRQMRSSAFSDENIGNLIEEYTRQMDAGGAYYRDAVRWGKENAYADAYDIYAYAIARFQMVDRRIAEIADESLAGHRLRIQGYTTFDEGLL